MGNHTDFVVCGAGFTVMGSGEVYDGDHRCIKPRRHAEPHKSSRGFVWGMADQSIDPYYVRLVEYDRKLAEKRARAKRRWYNKLAARVRGQ